MFQAIINNHTRYTPGSGTYELKEAILHKVKRDNNLEYDIKNVIVSCGAKHSLYNACQALFESGDEVIIGSWQAYVYVFILQEVFCSFYTFIHSTIQATGIADNIFRRRSFS